MNVKSGDWQLVVIRLLFGGASLMSVGIVVLAAAMLGWGELTAIGRALVYGVPMFAAAAFASAAARPSRKTFLVVVTESVGAVLALLVVEWVLGEYYSVNQEKHDKLIAIAEHLGVPFDARRKSEVIDDLIADGVDAVPGFAVDFIHLPYVRKHIPEEIVPLGNVSGSVVVECNEGGEYLIFTSDEHGLNNPPGLYVSGQLDVVAVGSSYTMGHCVDPSKNMIAHIRSRYPRTLNLGMAGHHSLSMLAALREFVEPLKPKVVLWMAPPWILNTRAELQSEFLIRYLEPDFSQNLMGRQDEVDSILLRALPPVMQDFYARLREAEESRRNNRWKSVLTLFELRQKVLPTGVMFETTPPQIDVDLSIEVFRLAQDTVRSWGGELYFVYIPVFDEVVAGINPEPFTVGNILPLIESTGAPIIDGHELFVQQKDPAGLYSLRTTNHYNEEGYRLMGDLILRHIEEPLARMSRVDAVQTPPQESATQ